MKMVMVFVITKKKDITKAAEKVAKKLLVIQAINIEGAVKK